MSTCKCGGRFALCIQAIDEMVPDETPFGDEVRETIARAEENDGYLRLENCIEVGAHVCETCGAIDDAWVEDPREKVEALEAPAIIGHSPAAGEVERPVLYSVTCAQCNGTGGDQNGRCQRCDGWETIPAIPAVELITTARFPAAGEVVPDAPGPWWRDEEDWPVQVYHRSGMLCWVGNNGTDAAGGQSLVWTGGKVIDDGHWLGPCRKPGSL